MQILLSHFLRLPRPRYRFDKVKERAKLKTSIARLCCILFPELEKLVPTLHLASVYALLTEFPQSKTEHHSASDTVYQSVFRISQRPLRTRQGHRDTGSYQTIYSKSLELRHTIRLIRELDAELKKSSRQYRPLWMSYILPLPPFPALAPAWAL